MAAHIPSSVLRRCRLVKGLKLLSRGKVRDIYGLPRHPGKLLVVATDRISIFDFVLNALVPRKGYVLTAMNIFWRQLINPFCANDLVAFGAAIDKYLPKPLRGNIDLQCRATVVRKIEIIPVECVVRGFLTGSGWEAYQQQDRTVCGHKLPPGLQNGSRLPFPIFTPTTKADSGHDMPLDGLKLGRYLFTKCSREMLGSKNNAEHLTKCEELAQRLERLSLQLYQFGAQFALERGLILADTKFEFGLGPGGHLDIILGDEVLTPDSSRYWDAAAWAKAQREGKLPPSLDKQSVRNWGKQVGIDRRKPDIPNDVAYVHRQPVTNEVIASTTKLYRYTFWRLPVSKLEQFQRFVMNVKVNEPRVNITVLLGSESDQPVVDPILKGFAQNIHAPRFGKLKRHICSCDRNPAELRQFLAGVKDTVLIGVAGLSARLPSAAVAELNQLGKFDIPVIGVGLLGSTADATDAARLAIEQIPGKPVVLNRDGRAFMGSEGLCEALFVACDSEFLPRTPVNKPANFKLPL